MQPNDAPVPPFDADRELEIARALARGGRIAEAEAGFQRVLDAHPGHFEALRFLGNAAFARGDNARSVVLLSHASRAEPGHRGVLVELGIVYRSAERLDAARSTFERALSLGAGHDAYVRLLLAQVLELDRRPELALLHAFRASIEAQQAQRWTWETVDPAALRALIGHARSYVAQGRRAWFESALRSLRQDAVDARWDRIDAALALHLGEREPGAGDPPGRTGLLHVPGIGTSPFPDRTLYPQLADANAALAPLSDDVEACIAESMAASRTPPQGLVLPVVARGIPQYEARRRAPRLLAALAGLPLARIPNVAPLCEIVALPPGSRTPAHQGLANSRCRAVVNLAGSGPLGIAVGNEQMVLEAGQSTVLDPAFGVAWFNPGRAPTRAIAIELWHADLMEIERRALSALFVAALDFENRVQDLP